MSMEKLRELLDGQNVKYVTIRHSPAFTAPEVAASAHVKGKEMAKAVVVKLDGRLALAVLPANRKVDFELLKQAASAGSAELAHESDFAHVFPDCELGAMPPFGNLYNLPVYVAPQLAEDREIAFNGGSHAEVVRMAYADFARLAQPKVAPLCR